MKIPKRQLGITPLVIVLIVVGVLFLAGAGFWYWENARSFICSMEARKCPDGSYVGRVGPRCEFAACPEVKDETANWKTFDSIKDGDYRSGYLFTLRYPSTWYYETNTTKEGFADDQSTKFSDYTLSRGEEGILLKPIPKENCVVFIGVDYTKNPKQPNFVSYNSYSDPVKKAVCDSTIHQIKKSLSAEFTIQ